MGIMITRLIFGFILLMSLTAASHAKQVFEAKLHKNPNGHYFIKVNIGDVKANILVDTGAAIPHLYWPFAENHQKGLKVSKLEDFIPIGQDKLVFDKGEAIAQPIHVVPDTEFDQMNFEDGFDGSIPPQCLLKDGYVVVDFKNRKLIGLQGTDEEIQADLKAIYKDSFQTLDLIPHQDLPHLVVNIHLKDKKEQFPVLLDTGGGLTIIHKDYVPAASKTVKVELGFYSGIKTFEVAKKVIYQLANLDFTPDEETLLFAQDPDIDQEILVTGEKVKGIIGMDILKKTILVVPSDTRKKLFLAKIK